MRLLSAASVVVSPGHYFHVRLASNPGPNHVPRHRLGYLGRPPDTKERGAGRQGAGRKSAESILRIRDPTHPRHQGGN